MLSEGGRGGNERKENELQGCPGVEGFLLDVPGTGLVPARGYPVRAAPTMSFAPAMIPARCVSSLKLSAYTL